MNRKAAHRLITEEMAVLRSRPYELLRDEFLDKPRVREGVDADGEQYELEVEAFWDDKAGGNLRVIVCVLAGPLWRRLCPFTDSFIISPTGEFIGE